MIEQHSDNENMRDDKNDERTNNTPMTSSLDDVIAYLFKYLLGQQRRLVLKAVPVPVEVGDGNNSSPLSSNQAQSMTSLANSVLGVDAIAGARQWHNCDILNLE